MKGKILTLYLVGIIARSQVEAGSGIFDNETFPPLISLSQTFTAVKGRANRVHFIQQWQSQSRMVSVSAAIISQHEST